jgi:hypothetical protein
MEMAGKHPGPLALFFCAAFMSVASAAEVRIDPAGVPQLERITKIVLTGKISRGDAARVDKLVEGEDSAIVFLDSTGGDYREGLALARLFKQRKVRTAVSSGKSCLSACAIAFLGGTAYGEEGTEPFARSIAPNARLAFHAPFIEITAGDLRVEQIEAAYDTAIRTVTDFVRVARDLGISPEVAADMMTPQRAALYRIATVRDLVRASVEVQDIPRPETLTRSMAVNLCLNGWVEAESGENGMAIVAEGMKRLQENLKWPDKSTIKIKSDYFTGARILIKRTVLPIAEAGEASGFYSCMIDHVEVAGDLRVENRGYIFTETDREIMDRAADFGQPGFEQLTQLDVVSHFAIGAIDPLAPYDYSDEERLGVVPPETPIGKIEELVKSYLASEPPL